MSRPARTNYQQILQLIANGHTTIDELTEHYPRSRSGTNAHIQAALRLGFLQPGPRKPGNGTKPRQTYHLTPAGHEHLHQGTPPPTPTQPKLTRRKPGQKNYGRYAKLTPRDAALDYLNCRRGNRTYTPHQLARYTGHPPHQLAAALHQLHQEGRIIRTGAGTKHLPHAYRSRPW